MLLADCYMLVDFDGSVKKKLPCLAHQELSALDAGMRRGWSRGRTLTAALAAISACVVCTIALLAIGLSSSSVPGLSSTSATQLLGLDNGVSVFDP
jgi:hypothetical protein